jgi:hydroxymethylpyrimidine/phosphomethylpyrimidine kinase
MTAPPARPCVLVFAGLDPSGGAGLGADAQAVAGQGAHALTVCTALTVQDNDRVHGVQPVDAALVLRQAQALADKVAIAAVKIGITGSAVNAQAIAAFVAQLRRRQPQLPVVLDPVLASGHGDLLSRDDAAQALAPLLPLATVLTPNGPEARALGAATAGDVQAARLRARGCAPVLPTGGHDDGPEARALSAATAADAQAAQLRLLGCDHVLLTGGHDDGIEVVNRWYGPGMAAARAWHWPRLAGAFHGSGCTLAAAIAGQLACGLPVAAALDQAQHYVYHALRAAYAIADGQRIPLR